MRRQSRALEDNTALELTLDDITEEEISNFRTMEGWLENSECERDGLAEHCKMLNIANVDKPYITGMSPTLTLKFWQPIAVAFILIKEDTFTKGCIISDQVGLGKTFEALAAVLMVRFLSSRLSSHENGHRLLCRTY